MTSQELKDRTKAFAKDCLKLLKEEKGNGRLFWHIESQLIRCATSVAANYRAACLAQSKASFVAKLSIVIEEADESLFWLELWEEESDVKNTELMNRLKSEALQLTKIFISSRKSMAYRDSK